MTIKENRAIPEGKKRTSLSSLLEKKGKLKILASPLFIGGVLLILCASFGVVYFQKQADANDFQSQISKKEEILNKSVSAPNLEDLLNQRTTKEAELEQKMSELEKRKSGSSSSLALSLPDQKKSIDLYKEIVDFGEAANLSQPGGVEIKNITASSPVKGKNNDITLTYSLSVEGRRDALLNFISNLIKSQKYLCGMELKNVAIAGGAKSGDPATLTLGLDVHTWPD
jgi:hypothetical protein